MAYSALLEYIRKAKGCGATDADITERLVRAGWYRVDAQDALALYERLMQPVARIDTCEPLRPAPRPSVLERFAPRHYEPHLIAVAALAFVVGFIAYVVVTR